MTVRTHWPWISVLLAACLALNPVGLDFIYSGFFSGEALARNIAGPIVLTALAIIVLIALLEWSVRLFLLNRRGRGKTTG